MFTLPQRLSLPLLTGKLTAITGRASALVNRSVGVVGVSEERETVLLILARGDDVVGNRTANLASVYYKWMQNVGCQFGINPYMGGKC